MEHRRNHNQSRLRTRRWSTRKIADAVVRALAEDRFRFAYEIAIAAHIHPTYLSKIFHGEHVPTDPVALRIATALGVDPDELVEDEGEPCATY